VWIFKFIKNIPFIFTVIITLVLIPVVVYALFWILFTLASIYFDFAENQWASSALKEYQPVVEYIDDCKNRNGVYPKTINELDIKSESLPFYEYKTFNNENDFILKVYENEFQQMTFRYCSQIEFEDCDPSIQKWPNKHWQIREWVATEFID